MPHSVLLVKGVFKLYSILKNKEPKVSFYRTKKYIQVKIFIIASVASYMF